MQDLKTLSSYKLSADSISTNKQNFLSGFKKPITRPEANRHLSGYILRFILPQIDFWGGIFDFLCPSGGVIVSILAR